MNEQSGTINKKDIVALFSKTNALLKDFEQGKITQGGNGCKYRSFYNGINAGFDSEFVSRKDAPYANNEYNFLWGCGLEVGKNYAKFTKEIVQLRSLLDRIEEISPDALWA